MVDIESATIVLTGAGVIVAIVYGILTLRDTSRTRQADLYMRIYERASAVEFFSDYELYADKSQWSNFDASETEYLYDELVKYLERHPELRT